VEFLANRTMKLNILSDLHLTRGALVKPENDADAVILAGDIARPKQALSWASDLGKPVLYIPGNHEFYSNTIRYSRGTGKFVRRNASPRARQQRSDDRECPFLENDVMDGFHVVRRI
jgi:predicted phosphodiesterase